MKLSKQRRSRKNERGTSVIEFMLWMPMIFFILVFFIGLGWTLMLRQQTLIAARYAAFYKEMGTSSPSAPQVSGCVSPRGEQWQLIENSSAAESTSGLSAGSTDGGISSEFESVVSQLGVTGTTSYQAEVVPRLGPLPSLLQLSNSRATYVLPTGTWTGDGCGAYQSLLTSGISILVSSF
jgi:hypothetical protein